MNAQQKKAVTAAIRAAVENGKAGWKKDIIPAVKAVAEIPENGWMEVRTCLQSLLTVGLIKRAAFDPTADDEYYVTPNTPGAR